MAKWQLSQRERTTPHEDIFCAQDPDCGYSRHACNTHWIRNFKKKKKLFSYNNDSKSVFLLVKLCGFQPEIMPFPSLGLTAMWPKAILPIGKVPSPGPWVQHCKQTDSKYFGFSILVSPGLPKSFFHSLLPQQGLQLQPKGLQIQGFSEI